MTQVVLSIETAQAVNVAAANDTKVKAEGAVMSREVVFLGITLAVLQVLDGVLTAIGVHHFGIGAEANLFIKWCMEQVGPNTALIVLKSFAMVVIVALCFMAKSVSWLKPAMKTVIAIYLFAAIIPWSAILAKNLL